MRESARAGEEVSVCLNQYGEFLGVLRGVLSQDTDGESLHFEYGSTTLQKTPGVPADEYFDNFFVVRAAPESEQDSHVNAYPEIFDLSAEAFQFDRS